MRAAGRRPLLGVAVGLAVVLLGTAGLIARHRLGPKHLMTVTPGVLYRSGQLTPDQLEEVVDRHGIRTVVNLRSVNERARGDWYAREAERLERLGVRLVDLPMNTGFPPGEAALAGWLAVLDDAGAAPVLVHCEYGVVRTGIMVAVYEVERLGRSSDEALARFELFGRDLDETIRSRIDAWFAGYVPRGPRG